MSRPSRSATYAGLVAQEVDGSIVSPDSSPSRCPVPGATAPRRLCADRNGLRHSTWTLPEPMSTSSYAPREDVMALN